MTRPTHYIDPDALDQLAFDGHYLIEVGHDRTGDYKALVTREGTEYRARLAATPC